MVDFAVGDELIGNGFRRIDGDGEADVLGGDAGLGLGGDERIDADDVAVDIAERAAGVAGVDGRVGLDEPEEEGAGLIRRAAGGLLGRPAEGADDAGADGRPAGEGERVTDGDQPITGGKGTGLAELRDGEIVARIWRTARLVWGSAPISFASNERPSGSATVRPLAPSMTWLLVMMWPLSS